MVIHNIPPVFDEQSETLILGSFPSVKSREQAFFYGHSQNRFWRVLACVLSQDVPTTIEEKKAFLLKNKIAVWDVLQSCEIEGSSDGSITSAVPNDIQPIIDGSNIKRIFLNGGTAEKYYNLFLRDKINIPATRLPSTSPANAAFSLASLIEQWSQIV